MIKGISDPVAPLDRTVSRRFPLRGSRIQWSRLALASLLLAACLFFSIADATLSNIGGIAVDSRWRVLEVTVCDSFLSICSEETALTKGDQLLAVGNLTHERFLEDRGLALFQGFREGQSVPIVLEREGNVLSTEWQIPSTPLYSKVGRIAMPLLAYFPFWLAGTAILLFMQPHNRVWRYYILLLFVTAFWLAVGFASNSRVVFSSPIMHATTWLMVPTYLALHLEAPKPFLGRSRPYLVPAIWSVAAILALLELVQWMPFFAYLFALLAVIGSSVFLLIRRLASDTSPEVWFSSRLMLIGLLAAYIPAALFWLLPTAEGSGASSALVVALSIAPFPFLPLFYTFAVYKQRLGKWETRLNNLLRLYAALWLYLIVFSTTIFLAGRWVETTNSLLLLGLTVALGLVLLGLVLRDPYTRLWNRLAYGRTYSPRDIFARFASQIPAAKDSETLIGLLSRGVSPLLQILQSALVLFEADTGIWLYRQGIETREAVSRTQDFDALLLTEGQYRPPAPADNSPPEEWSWVRLAVPLRLHQKVTGLWLFGQRYPDDYYTEGDVRLLQDLAKLVAVAVETGRLLQQVADELAERKRAERALAGYAERLELMHEIDLAILAADSPARIARVAVERVHAIVPCVRASINLFDRTSNEVELLAAIGGSAPILSPGQRSNLSDYEGAINFSASQPQRIEDVRQLGEASKTVQALLAMGVQSLIVVPLVATDRVIGTLNVGLEDASGMSDEAVDIVTEVAYSVAVAMQNARLLEAVTRYSQDLRLLSAQLLEAQELERQRISYELHDEMGQVLAAVTFGLAAVERALPADSSAAIHNELADISDLVEQLIRQVRELSLELRPSMLQDLGLASALRWYIGHYARRTEADVELQLMGMEERISSDVETAVYRIVQEGLTNVARHAQADHVRVQLSRVDGMVRLVIEDDGCGFEADSMPAIGSGTSGVGLVGMRERVAMLGGQFSLRSAPGEGACIRIEIPLGDES